MAAPPDVTTKAMNGKFTLNKLLSDGSDEILRIQGVSWLKRRAISLFVPSLCLTHVPVSESDGPERIDVVQTLSGGLSGAIRDTCFLDGQEREKESDLFGFMTGAARLGTLGEDVTDEFLKEGWAQDCIEHGVVLNEAWSTPGKNSYTWKAVQVWGFAVVEGARRFVRRTTFTSPEKDGAIHVRFVYDYVGAV